MSKVLEEVMHEQTTEFLYKHKTLYMFPSRFKKSHSIDFYLSYLNEKKKKKSNGVNAGFLIGLFFVDLQKVFETIDYNIFYRL